MDGNLRVTPESYNSNPGSASPIRNGSYTYHNFQFGYQFPGSKIDVYLGIDNAFDKGRRVTTSVRTLLPRCTTTWAGSSTWERL